MKTVVRQKDFTFSEKHHPKLAISVHEQGDGSFVMFVGVGIKVILSRAELRNVWSEINFALNK